MQEPTLISQLVAIAVQAVALQAAQQSLDTGAPSPEAADRLTDVAETLDLTSGFHKALLAERAFGLAIFDYVKREDATSTQELLGGGPSEVLLRPYQGPLGAPLRAFDQARFLANWRVYMDNLDIPYRLQDRDATEQALTNDSVLAILTKILLPALTRASAKRDQAIATRDEFQIALALKVHRQQHGAYPVSLAELQATLDWQLPDDPFSGQPYGYERRDQGFALWSVGEDMEDDGGIPPKPRSDLDWDEADIVWLSTR